MNKDVNHISIDLETLGTERDSVILSVGICTDRGREDDLIVHIDIDQQMDERRKISGDTLRWWMRQNDDARREIHAAKALDVTTARDLILHHLRSLPKAKRYYVWANSPTFDCEMLAHFLGVRPWPWWSERDIRTARMPFPNRSKSTVAHSALADAKAQLADALRFMAMIKMLEGGDAMSAAKRADKPQAEPEPKRQAYVEAPEPRKGIRGWIPLGKVGCFNPPKRR